jgi:hypothetical protein
MGNEGTLIQYCQEHYDELVFALLQRGLEGHISRTQDEMIEKLKAGEMDAALESSNAITAGAISMFGPEIILAYEGCPVCTFHKVIEHVADHIAVKYKGTN